MLPKVEPGDTGNSLLQREREQRCNKACAALGRLGSHSNHEQREAVLTEFFAAHEELARPLGYKPQKETRRVNLPQKIELGLLQWLVDLQKLPDRSIQRHARENGLGVEPDVCIEVWRKRMPERFEWESRRRAKLRRK